LYTKIVRESEFAHRYRVPKGELLNNQDHEVGASPDDLGVGCLRFFDSTMLGCVSGLYNNVGSRAKNIR
jgi:hypothetical protein